MQHALKVLITRRVHAGVLDLLKIHAEIVVHDDWKPMPPALLARQLRDARAVLTFPADRIDAGMIEQAPALRIVACAFDSPDKIDVAACTQRGIWITDVAPKPYASGQGFEHALEAARNIVDVLNGDRPRGALNHFAAAA